MSKNTIYICMSGCEGTGKSTQTDKLVQYLKSKNYSVLQTKEPGTPLLPVTIKLRALMLDSMYQDNIKLLHSEINDILRGPDLLTKNSINLLTSILQKEEQEISIHTREYLSQAIRSIHLEKLIFYELQNGNYDYIIQDRGILSSLAYGFACGNDLGTLKELTQLVTLRTTMKEVYTLYNLVILLQGDTKRNLQRAIGSKQEFKNGDIIELRANKSEGNVFMETVNSKMLELSKNFNTKIINVDDKDVETVFGEIRDIVEN